MSEKPEKIAVAGATGYVGGHLVPALHEAGFTVRCLARTPEKIAGRNWSFADVARADVFEPESLISALNGIDVAYYLVHSMSTTGDFQESDRVAASNFASASKTAGVQRIIYLGGLGSHNDDLSAHLQSRQEVGKVLGESGIPVTELRASIIIGSGSASFEIIRDLARKLPVMITPKWVNSRCEPIAIDNVITYLVQTLTTPETIDQILEIGGGDVLTYGDMMHKVSEITGHPLLMLKVPVLTPRLSAYWLNLVTSVPMSVAFPLVDGLRNDTVCHDQRIRDWIPQDLISFESAVQKALAEADNVLESRWTEASLQSFSDERTDEGLLLRDIRTVESDLAPEAIFTTVKQIGGETGWYSLGWAWQIRGFFDRLIGGVGMRRGRRDPVDIRIGDVIDFWRVVDFMDNRYIRLQAEMKLPGRAWLEFEVTEFKDSRCKLIQTASFIPSGVPGYLYWYVLYPIHVIIFHQMAHNIVESATQSKIHSK